MPGRGRIGRRRINEAGYVRICVSSDNSEEFEHRIVAEQILGRVLLPGEVVHHRNGVRDDNRPENLVVLPSQSIHARHHLTVERSREMQRRGADTRYRRTMEDLLPRVVAGVRVLISRGIKPTQRNCRSVPGYDTIQRYVPQSELVALAKGGAPFAP